jgi:pyruvate dehydrogenase E1 component alpha subunit
VFLGDGAIEEGTFYESVNFAALRQLPVVFLCENNQYSVYTPLEQRQPVDRRIIDVARSLGIRAVEVDGHSAVSCLAVLERELPSVRTGGGPSLIEFSTHRYLEHCGPNDDEHLGYRAPGELEAWKGRDPINSLIHELSLDEQAITAMRAPIEAEIDDAFAFARESSFPDPASLEESIYA